MMSEDSKVLAPAGRPKPPNAGKGRKKGVPNKVTRDIREAIRDLLDRAGPQMVEWLEKVAEEDPAKALDLVAKFSEYAMPKLSRAVVKAPGTMTLAELVAAQGEPTEERRYEAKMLVDRELADSVDAETRERIAGLLAEQPRVTIVTGVPAPDSPMTSDDYEPILPPRGGDVARYPAPLPAPIVPEPPPRAETWAERMARLQGNASEAKPKPGPRATNSEFDPYGEDAS